MIIRLLLGAFAQTPKPTRHIREQLAQETGLTMRVIQVRNNIASSYYSIFLPALSVRPTSVARENYRLGELDPAKYDFFASHG